MRRNHLSTLFVMLSLGAIGAASCSSASGGGGGSGGALAWYTTCGDPVCQMTDGGTGGPAACTTQKAGDPCTTAGQECDPGSGCHVYLECTDHDPKLPGCPISRAQYKKDIAYVPDARLSSLHDELMTMRLATYRYKSEPDGSRTHLGFIIDDDPESPAVGATGERVDLYGYTSMVAAAAQVQDRRIQALEREIATLREQLAALRKPDACR